MLPSHVIGALPVIMPIRLRHYRRFAGRLAMPVGIRMPRRAAQHHGWLPPAFKGWGFAMVKKVQAKVRVYHTVACR